MKSKAAEKQFHLAGRTSSGDDASPRISDLIINDRLSGYDIDRCLTVHIKATEALK